jgi:predicted nucleotidyltransferase
MGRVSIDHVEAGMVLSKDAYNFRKQLLLPRGTVISPKNLEMMKTWGVSEVETEGCSEPTLEEVEVSLAQHPGLAATVQVLDDRFSKVRHDPLMKEILTIAKKQLLENAQL